MAHKFHPENYRRLHSRDRLKFQEPSKLIGLLELFPGAKVADVGCGSGFFTLEVARRLDGGEVWAVDISQEMLDRLKEHMEKEEIHNVNPLLSQESQIPLKDCHLDRVLLSTVLHEAEDKVAFLKEIRRVLKPGGKLVLTDWHKASSPEGPPLKHRVTEEEARRFLAVAGFKEIEAHPLYEYHYVLTAEA